MAQQGLSDRTKLLIKHLLDSEIKPKFSLHYNTSLKKYDLKFNPLPVYPAISTGNSNVAKSAHPAISAGMCFSSFIDELFPFIPRLST